VWLPTLWLSKPFNVVVETLANKLTRIAWAVQSKGQAFDAKVLQPGLQ